jgi:ribosomal protein L31
MASSKRQRMETNSSLVKGVSLKVDFENRPVYLGSQKRIYLEVNENV